MLTNPKRYRNIFKEAVAYLFPNEIENRSLFFDSKAKSDNTPIDINPQNYREDKIFRYVLSFLTSILFKLFRKVKRVQ